MKAWQGRGAILAEVLVAAVILAVGLMAVLGLFIQTQRAGTAMKHQQQAVYLANARLEALRNQAGSEWSSADLLDACREETVMMGGVAYQREVNAGYRTDLDGSGNLMEVEVKVRWTEEARESQVVLITYFVVDVELENLR